LHQKTKPGFHAGFCFWILPVFSGRPQPQEIPLVGGIRRRQGRLGPAHHVKHDRTEQKEKHRRQSAGRPRIIHAFFVQQPNKSTE
jgi:hypothetical protein